MGDVSVVEIWIEAEEIEERRDGYDDNSDVIITLDDGSRWGATFHSYQNIQTLIDKNRATGECLSGSYLWSVHMILVDRIARDRIEAVITDLITDGTFKTAFEQLDHPDATEPAALATRSKR